jgi:hypothetical protein
MSSDLLKLDMHVHSIYSLDSLLNVDKIFSGFKKTGILPIICDHDSLKGSIKFGQLLKNDNSDYPIIYGEEISTLDGELIGLFISTEILHGMSAMETIDQIHDQGGFVVVPHPFDRFRHHVLNKQVMNAHINDLDIIEGYNARNLISEDNLKAVNYAQLHNKTISCGSDAHTFYELGKTYLELPFFDDQKELINVLQKANIYYHPVLPFVHGISKIVRMVGASRF